MSAKRWLILSALVATSLASGCQRWCERNYPCPAPAYAQQPCVPICAPGVSAYQNIPAPPPPPATNNFGSSRSCTCTCP